EGRPATLLGSWAIVGLSFSLYLANLGLAHYLITLIAVASLALDWRVAAATTGLSFYAFLLNAWYTTSSSAYPLPDLLSLPRLPVYLALVGLVTITAVLIVVWRRVK
ncbi:MAG: hypothetical protein ACRDH2_18780, partial [Anaerolineales bacterium]